MSAKMLRGLAGDLMVATHLPRKLVLADQHTLTLVRLNSPQLNSTHAPGPTITTVKPSAAPPLSPRQPCCGSQLSHTACMLLSTLLASAPPDAGATKPYTAFRALLQNDGNKNSQQPHCPTQCQPSRPKQTPSVPTQSGRHT